MGKSDLSTFFEDLAAVRPTVMLLIPRLANMMYDKLVGQLEQAPEGSEHAKAAYKQVCSLTCCGNLQLTGVAAARPWSLCVRWQSFSGNMGWHGIANMTGSQAMLYR